MQKAASTWNRLRLRLRLFAMLAVAICLLVPAEAAGDRSSARRDPAMLPCETAFALQARHDRGLPAEMRSVASRSACASPSPAAPVPKSPPPGTPMPPSGFSCSKVALPGQGTAQALLESLSSDEVGCLRGGTYTASGSYALDYTSSNVTIMSYPGERAVLVGVMVVRAGASGSRLAGVAVEGTGGPTGESNTIQVLGASDFVLEDSDVTNAWRGRSCVILGDRSAGVAVRPVIRRNRFHECGNPANGNQDHAIYAANVVEAEITENLFWSNTGYALHLYPNAQRTLAAHNVIDGGAPSVSGGVVVGGDSGTASSGNIVEYNVIAYSTRFNVESWWGGDLGSGNVARFNCVFGGGSGDIGAAIGFVSQRNLVADPLFVNRAGHDYHLRAGSPCVAVVGYDTAARLG